MAGGSPVVEFEIGFPQPSVQAMTPLQKMVRHGGTMLGGDVTFKFTLIYLDLH